ncbi:MAG: hypothetical protein B6I24_04790 [Bacteroidetes bacterium 4572_128]|nr:MAG: hypothetical protein B6I24_04790 [Bacteroidetes bacterium 4572_128]
MNIEEILKYKFYITNEIFLDIKNTSMIFISIIFSIFLIKFLRKFINKKIETSKIKEQKHGNIIFQTFKYIILIFQIILILELIGISSLKIFEILTYKYYIISEINISIINFLIAIFLFFISKKIIKFIEKAFKKRKIKLKNKEIFFQILKYATIIFSLLIILKIFGIMNLILYKFYFTSKINISIFKIIIIISIVFSIKTFLNHIKKFVNNKIEKGKINKTYSETIFNILKYIFFITVFILLSEMIGIEIMEIMRYEFKISSEISISIIDIFIIFSALFLIKHFSKILKEFFDKKINDGKIDKGRGNTVFQISKYFSWILISVFLLEMVGIKMTILVASSAALMVGLGFGLQNIFNDIISGIILLFERDIEVGNLVEVDNIMGQISHINLRTTSIVSPENITIIVPNSKFTTENLINWTHIENKKASLNLIVGVAYGSNLELVKSILLKCGNEHKDVEKKPSPLVFLKNFGDSSLDMKLKIWTYKGFFHEKIKSDLRFEIYKIFREKNIIIPFPQRDIYLKK